MSVTKISEKFTEKKAKFNSYIDNPQLFDCYDFNIIKLFQYAIFREEGFRARLFWKLPYFLINFIFFLKRLKIKNKPIITRNEKIKIFIGDCERSIETIQKEYKSRYYENILNQLNRKQVLFFKTNTLPSKVQHDLNFEDFYQCYSFLPLNEDDKILLRELRKTYSNILKQIKLDNHKIKLFEEIIEIFWREYRTYREILKNFPNIQLAFVFPHYQKESLLYALRKRKIKIIELQHGLIAEEDMFYVYDKKIIPVRHKALFADEIWLYGEYWKSVLSRGYEYDTNQMKIFGYYLFYEKNFSTEFIDYIATIKSKFSKILFATAQKNLEHHLADYINFLVDDAHSKKQSIAIIIKPHPSATQDISKFINNRNNNVFITNYPTEWLFQICDAHFSIYSTTLFDALLFGVKHNYAINHPLFSDYVESIVKKGVAKELSMNENILDKIQNSQSDLTLNANYFYTEPNYEILKNEIATL
ncbi:MAG: hypothetical protein KatS3mg027_1587 [Bacteroidia bacterium]|nr:MAG: hypothetical protein KatS3mg027_1587 [Bacteroidia bacterium]